jgi:hypothetical protein
MAFAKMSLCLHGDPGRNRTLNLPIRSRLLYPVELRGHLCRFSAICPGLASVSFPSDGLDHCDNEKNKHQ